MNEAIYYRATAAAQAVMSQTAKIDVDGKWGKFTQQTYDAAPSSTQTAVKQVIIALGGGSPSELRSYRDAQRSVGNASVAKTAGTSDIREMIIAQAQKEGIPPTTALKIAYLESRLKPNAVSPTGAKGLFQLTGIAVRDVKDRMGYVVSDPFDPVQNTVGGLKYMKLVARDMKVGLDETAKLYMGFNIGPTGAKLVLSGKPEAAAKQINQQAYGKPAVYAANLTKAVENAQA